MKKKKAKYIGRREAYLTVLIGITIFYIVGVFIFSNEGLRSLLWISYLDLYNWVYVVNWIAAFCFLAYFVGSYAGKKILIQQQNPLKIGVYSGILMVVLGAFIGCFLGFLVNGLENIETNKTPVIDYFLVPIFWIVLYGIVPSILLGLGFGYRIKKFAVS